MIESVTSCTLKTVLQSKFPTAATWKFPFGYLMNTWWVALNSAILKVKKRKPEVKKQLSFCSIISLSGQRANWCSYGWPQLILHSLTALALLLVFQLTAIWKLWKPESISCSQVFPPSHPPHYGSVQSQLRLYSGTQWAIHHRWLGLLWKLAAMLPLGQKTKKIKETQKKNYNRAKLASGIVVVRLIFYLFFLIHLWAGNSVYPVVIEWHIYFSWHSSGQ